jgi:hypothetical protein
MPIVERLLECCNAHDQQGGEAIVPQQLGEFSVILTAIGANADRAGTPAIAAMLVNRLGAAAATNSLLERFVSIAARTSARGD